MKAERECVVGMDRSITPAISRELMPVLGTLGYNADTLQDPFEWLSKHPANPVVLAIPERTPRHIQAMRTTAPSALIIGVCGNTASAAMYRTYLGAGVTNIVGTEPPPDDFASILGATLRGFVVLPPPVANAMASRLEEIPRPLHLTARDKRLLGLIAWGSSPAAIALEIGCSERHLRRITSDLLERIGAVSRTHAASLATRWGLVAADGKAP